MRYFVRFYYQNLMPFPHLLFRLAINDLEESFTEEQWDDANGVWIPTDRIMPVLILGNTDIEEVDAISAQKFFPLAFKELTKSIGTYEMSKAEGDKRYTLGAMYIPDRLDAHGEWTSADELQRAVWDYVRTNDRRIRLQHDREVVAGEWVEVMAFPYELTVPITSISGIPTNHTYPANTVFLGVIWEPWAWEKIQNGEILGYSIGGKAERLYVDMEPIEVAKHGSHDQSSHGAWANGKYNPDDSEGEDESEPKNYKKPIPKLHGHKDDSEEEYEELNADDPKWMDDMDITHPPKRK